MACRHWRKCALLGLKSAFVGVLIFSTPLFAASTKLVLFGGGAFTEKAIEVFLNAAGGNKGHIVVVTWATEFPNTYYSAFAEAVQVNGTRETAPTLEQAPNYSEIDGKKIAFMDMLEKATAIFFTGGDQERIMDVFKKHPDLLAQVLTFYKEGKVIGGKSAGTAIASAVMITGGKEYRKIAPESVHLGDGAGFMNGLIVDQHFTERQREKRLQSAMIKAAIPLAFGVDEDNAVVVHDSYLLEPIGQHDLSIYRRLDKGMRFMEDVVIQGQLYDLKARAVVHRQENGELARVDEKEVE